MLTVHRCLGWQTKGKKVHEDVRVKSPSDFWVDYPEIALEQYKASYTFTDTMCPDCQKAMEELYNKPIDELIDDAKEMEVEQKGAKKGELC